MIHYLLIIERITVWAVVLVLAFSIYVSGTLIITYLCLLTYFSFNNL